MTGPTVDLSELTTHYNSHGNCQVILDHFSSRFEAGKVHVLSGPNGCGKSTLLKAIAGRVTCGSGSIHFSPSGVVPEMIPQDFWNSLFPWKSVKTNFVPWRKDGGSDHHSGTAIAEMLNLTSIIDFASPSELSGGQQERIALGRTLRGKSTLLLLDEPFSALDVQITKTLMLDLRRLWARTKPTVIIALHNLELAALLADNVVICCGPPLHFVDCLSRPSSEPSSDRLREFYTRIAEASATRPANE